MTGGVWDRYEALGEGDRSGLTAKVRATFAICDLRQEVNSGGFDGYFRYWGGNTATEALAALPEVLGADWHDLLADAMNLFGTPYLADPDARAEFLDERGLSEALDNLDTRFYALEEAEDVDARLNEYFTASGS